MVSQVVPSIAGESPMTQKQRVAAYWTLTIAILAPHALAGTWGLFTDGPAEEVASLHQLGYPVYLLKILGVSWILGAIAIVSGRSPKLKEWAYAGFSFVLLGASASHLFSGNFVHALLPLVDRTS
jgi:uncharacterized membrane protein YphA (DoxX/SURF4 family)